VVHLAAALRGSRQFVVDCAVKGTKNVAVAAQTCGTRRVIYMGSMSVYDFSKLRDGGIISEDSPLEEFAELRGTYSLAKRLAEAEGLSHLNSNRPAWTILRPSVVVGNGHDIFSPVGKRLGNFLLSPGFPKKILRLIHVEDVAAAIATVIQNDGTRGRIFNLSNETLTQRDYIEQIVRKKGFSTIRVIYVPYWVAGSTAAAIRALRLLSRGLPNLNRRRLAYLYRRVQANSDAIQSETGWQPRKNLLQTLSLERSR
jgi:nucleoside-diphosphate-sugar epimerase